MTNRLAGVTSPYLQQHRDNPVHWQPWDHQALAEARDRDRPILLSIGYAACHWCHVMAHESFEDPAIAAVMNERFVNIKVDREERPDLDQIYQQALALLGQQGGWPLTMFLTPAGEPFWGGTYFPPQSKYGRPGFPEVLETVARIWDEQRDRVADNTDAMTAALVRLARPTPGDALTPGLEHATARRIVQAFDTIHGGLAGAPKFPQTPLLGLVWRRALASGDPALRHAVRHTLTNICQGGIYDHLGGGFARYAVDSLWLVPHFEKMLYDNAQLLELLADVSADTMTPLFAARAEETVAWLEREMLVEGGFASSLDADSDGEEGKYYVWTAAEVDRLLGAEAEAFRLAYGVTDTGNWEGKTVLNRLHHPTLLSPAEEATLAAQRAVLLAARAERPPPARDDKVLADWNGMTIAALARASAVFGRSAWLERAIRAFAFVCRTMSDGPRLNHAWRGGRALDLGFLDDYAQMARAALVLFEHTGDDEHLARAQAWVDHLDALHLDPARGGYFQVATDATDLIVRPKTAHDGPTPAGNAVMVEVLARLHHLTGDDRHRRRAADLLQEFAGEAQHNPLAHAALLANRQLLEQPVQLVLVGPSGDPRLNALRRVGLVAAPPVLVSTVTPDRVLPSGHPATGKGMLDGCPTAHLCIGQTCRLPITDPAQLRRDLRPGTLRSLS